MLTSLYIVICFHCYVRARKAAYRIVSVMCILAILRARQTEEPREWILPQSVLVTPLKDLVILVKICVEVGRLKIWVEDPNIDRCLYLEMPMSALL
jgi:hypothetical protein